MLTIFYSPYIIIIFRHNERRVIIKYNQNMEVKTYYKHQLFFYFSGLENTIVYISFKILIIMGPIKWAQAQPLKSDPSPTTKFF